MMSDFTLTVPEDVYDLAQKIAQETAQPVEQLMIDHLRNLSTPLPTLPPDEQEELNAFKLLSDDTLWTIAREQMPDDAQVQMQILMDKNSLGTISEAEFNELSQLVERGNRLMVRKAEAAGLLMERDHHFSQQDFKPPHE